MRQLATIAAMVMAYMDDERGFLGITLAPILAAGSDLISGGSGGEPRADINTGSHNIRYCSSGSFPLAAIELAWKNSPQAERLQLYRQIGADQPGNSVWKEWSPKVFSEGDKLRQAILAHMTNGGFDCRITDAGESRSQQRMGAFLAKYAQGPSTAPATDDPSASGGGGFGGVIDAIQEAVGLNPPVTDEPAGSKVTAAGFAASPLVFLAVGAGAFLLFSKFGR